MRVEVWRLLRRYRWLSIFFLALLPTIHAQGAPLVLTADMRRASLEGRLEHYSDASGALTFEAVRLKDFALLPRFRSQGYDNATHWYRFEVSRALEVQPHWILSIGTLMLDEVDVWAEQPDGGYRYHALGDHRSYDARPLQTRRLAVPVEVFAQTRVYLRVRSTSSINVSADLWQPNVFMAEETRANFRQGLYFGILLIVAAFYAIVGAWSRDAVLASYAAYVVSLIPLHMGYNGYLPVVLPSDIPWLNDALWRIGFLAGILSLVYMWTRLMDLPRNFPRIHRLYRATALFVAALLPLIATPVYQILTPLMNLVAISLSVVTPTLLGILWRRSRRIELLVYFVAFALPVAGVVLQALIAMGGMPSNELTAHAYQYTSLVHMIVMSFGLALRLRQMNRDKAAAEREATMATQRAEEQRRFVAMLSHEFRNPLVVIDSSARMIQIKLPDLEPPEAQRLERIRANAATLAGFVDNFLMTEALDHGALVLAREHCAIRPLIEAAVHMQGDAAGERVRVAVTPDDAAFDLDPTMFGVAVGNLIGNALRYSPPDSPVEIEAVLTDAGLRIRVADHGPGMSEDELAQLGMPYFRAAASLGKKGSGLGYHFTRRIVQAHGGELTARARSGAGLEVEMVLP